VSTRLINPLEIRTNSVLQHNYNRSCVNQRVWPYPPSPLNIPRINKRGARRERPFFLHCPASSTMHLDHMCMNGRPTNLDQPTKSCIKWWPAISLVKCLSCPPNDPITYSSLMSSSPKRCARLSGSAAGRDSAM
jgi:hypothetical protein